MKIINRISQFLLLFFLTGCTTAESQITEIRTFSGISGVALLGSGDVTITLGDKEEITIYAPADLIPYLLTENKDGILQIGKRKKGWKKYKNFNENVHYELIVRELTHVGVSGSGDIDAEMLSGENCSVKVSGSGNININELHTKKAKVHISGSGDIDISKLSANVLNASISGSGNMNIEGKTKELDVTISGSGNFNGDDFKAEAVSINIYGSGDAKLVVTDNLEVQIAGSGDVVYYGNPQVNSRVTGSGDIRHR